MQTLRWFVSCPRFTHVATGNAMLLYQGPTVISSGYSFESTKVMVELSGEAGIRASHWAFVGGQWPNTTGIRFGNDSLSLQPNKLLTNSGVWLSEYLRRQSVFFYGY
jgi:hypothetical protein